MCGHWAARSALRHTFSASLVQRPAGSRGRCFGSRDRSRYQLMPPPSVLSPSQGQRIERVEFQGVAVEDVVTAPVAGSQRYAL